MKALVLNSGLGKRLYPSTEYVPKALIEIGDKPILGHQMESLVECDLRTIIMTTGPFEQKIKTYLNVNHSYMHVTYVKNPEYRTTNYIYSMWLTKRFIDEDIILFHGDLFFDTRLMKRLIKARCADCVLVSQKTTSPKKDFKAAVKNGRVVKIGVELSNAHSFSAPLYKFSKSSFLRWLDEIEKFIEEGNVLVYAENALNRILHKISLHPVYYSREICLEIDTKEDLELARSLLKTRHET